MARDDIQPWEYWIVASSASESTNELTNELMEARDSLTSIAESLHLSRDPHTPSFRLERRITPPLVSGVLATEGFIIAC
jgi:hypothetical protein